eukprot:2690033-Rhodomonas_salina.2
MPGARRCGAAVCVCVPRADERYDVWCLVSVGSSPWFWSCVPDCPCGQIPINLDYTAGDRKSKNLAYDLPWENVLQHTNGDGQAAVAQVMRGMVTACCCAGIPKDVAMLTSAWAGSGGDCADDNQHRAGHGARRRLGETSSHSSTEVQRLSCVSELQTTRGSVLGEPCLTFAAQCRGLRGAGRAAGGEQDHALGQGAAVQGRHLLPRARRLPQDRVPRRRRRRGARPVHEEHDVADVEVECLSVLQSVFWGARTVESEAARVGVVTESRWRLWQEEEGEMEGDETAANTKVGACEISHKWGPRGTENMQLLVFVAGEHALCRMPRRIFWCERIPVGPCWSALTTGTDDGRAGQRAHERAQFRRGEGRVDEGRQRPHERQPQEGGLERGCGLSSSESTGCGLSGNKVAGHNASADRL